MRFYSIFVWKSDILYELQAASVGCALSISKILKNLNVAPTFFIGGLGDDDDGT